MEDWRSDFGGRTFVLPVEGTVAAAAAKSVRLGVTLTINEITR